MRDSQCRRFTIADAMLLVAATAVGFGVDRIPGWILFPDLQERGNAASLAFNYSQAIGEIQVGSIPFLTAWTIAFLVIRLRRPRPALRRCLREPGMVGCCVATVGILVNALWVLMLAIAYAPDPTADFFYRGGEVKVYALHVGFAVIGSWVGLVLVRGWTPIPCWIDRLGRVLGLLWISMIGIYLSQYMVHAYIKLWMTRGGG
jgi:hypothetical protein